LPYPVYTFDSTEFTMAMDRELYELCIDNNINTVALLIVFK
jgi:hypothetical protein